MAPMAYSGPYGPLNPDPNAQASFMPPQGPAPNPYAHLGTLAEPIAPPIAPEQPKATVGPATDAAREAIGKRSKLKEFQDSPYLSQALLAASKGFFDGDIGSALQGFGQGVSAFNQANMRPDVAGGPDDAFLIHTDANGNQTYTPNEQVQGYLTQKRADERLTKLSPKAPDGEKISDLIGRAALAVQKGLPADQARSYLQSLGIPDEVIPAEFTPAYQAFGATVPQAQAQETRQAAQAYRETSGDRQFAETVKQHGITNGYRAQANDRANASAARAAKGGATKPLKGYYQVSSKAEFDRLPSGTKFIAPDGSKRIKP